jgi:phosphoribosylglycinamide formyltransferase-1
MMSMKTIAVLASGRGSNFQVLVDSIASGYLPAICSGLISDNPEAYAVRRANAASIPVNIVDFYSFRGRADYEAALFDVMRALDPDLFVLAGYMRILGEYIVKHFEGRIMNIHPALLPSFAGLHAPAKALEYGVKVAGCTVHYVDVGVDSGPVIIQRCVPVMEDDDEDSLAARILKQEHEALPEAVKLFCEERLMVSGRRVYILPP